MAFVDGFRSSGGACGTGSFLGLTDWTEYGGTPNPAASQYTSGYTGEMATKANMGGLAFEPVIGSGSYDIYTIDVSDTETKTQIVLRANPNPQFQYEFYYALYLRVWDAAEETYTDTMFSYSNKQITLFDGQSGWAAYHTATVYGIFTTITYNGVQYLVAGCSESIQIDNVGVRAAWQLYMTPWASFKERIGGDIPVDLFSPEFGPAAEPEGYSGGSFDDHSDTVDFPTDPQSILNLGFINVYKCDTGSLIDFGAALFPEITWPSSISDVGDVLKSLGESIWNSKLIDYVISVHCVPGDVPAGTPVDIRIGARNMLGIQARKITKEYVTFDFGTLQTDRIFRNYADIMTGCKVFLPFYGYVPLPAEYWNGCTLHLKYKFNVIDGSFMAYLKAENCYYSKLDGIIGQYSGTACIHLPITGTSYASMFSSLIGSGASLAGNVAKGNVTGAASSLASIASTIGSGGADQGSGNYNASSSFMSMRTPHLLIELPVPQFPTNYAPEKGLPANITYVLGTLQGLVICDSPRITFACTEDEQKEIIAALQEGIII